ncbi:MAG: 16S rRNA (uracil(1498)-N(3))-methyltransferase [Spirochaetaceae bacterium]|jgi:16S rRNA (uracil1498-N3)-methyltransferase|nr:16S rRNA (uracil(1498)-N(3))-methyltransferase [Spirochaetaceae bacterium]
MKQFILRQEPDKTGLVRLSGKDFHYLVRVRRVRQGATLNCRLPSGKTAVLRITGIGDGTLSAECAQIVEESQQNEIPPIILFQSMAKGSKMDTIVRQAGETGVKEIVPFYSKHSTPLPRCRAGAPVSVDARTERWRRILIEARQQSGSSCPSSVRPPLGMDELFGYWEQIRTGREEVLALLVHETPLAKCGFHGYLKTVPDLVVLAVGPEGGFSPAEALKFVDAGFKPVTLGNTILRTETAALYSIAVVRTLIFERLIWTMN